MKKLKILTYNIQFGKNTDRIIDWVNRQLQYDVFCFQEFPKDKIKESMSVLERVPYGYRFTSSISKRKRIFGQLTIYRKDRLRLIRTEKLNLGINRLERSIIRNTIPRSCLMTMFHYKDLRITVANVHLVALTINKYKYRQVEAVARTLNSTKNPVIMLGDFNLSSFIGKKKLFRIMDQSGYATDHTRIATHRVGVFKHQFDYIFGKNCSVVYQKIKSVRLSDHLQVAAKVSFDTNELLHR